MVLNRVWFSREPRERINVFVFSTPNEYSGSRKHELSKMYHSSWSFGWILAILSALMQSLNYAIKRSENGFGKWHVLVWNWVWNWRTGRHTPTENSEEYSPGLNCDISEVLQSKIWHKLGPKVECASNVMRGCFEFNFSCGPILAPNDVIYEIQHVSVQTKGSCIHVTKLKFRFHLPV